jgi:hypothetical protein
MDPGLDRTTMNAEVWVVRCVGRGGMGEGGGEGGEEALGWWQGCGKGQVICCLHATCKDVACLWSQRAAGRGMQQHQLLVLPAAAAAAGDLLPCCCL